MADGDFRFVVNGYDSYDIRLGEELRGERATLGKSLLSVQKDLRIKAAYIAAIENCDLNAFPNKGFIAGYVRSYARYLNLNPETIFERFCLESGYSNSIYNSSVKTYKSLDERNLKNTGINTQLNWKPTGIAFKHETQNYRKNLLVYFTPIILIVFLGFGIAYGGWKILIDIQKLRIVPADNLPVILSELELNTAELVKEKENQKPLYFSDFTQTNDIQRVAIENIKNPIVKYRDGPISNIKLEDVGLLGLNAPKIEKDFYRQSNEISKKFSLKSIGVSEFSGLKTYSAISASTQKRENEKNIEKLLNNREDNNLIKKTNSLPYLGNDNMESINRSTNQINDFDLNIFAVKPSWIRINNQEKKVVVEKILKSGEILKIKKDWLNGNLRSGNARDLFFALDGVTYGPVSNSKTVIKKFPIDPDYIFETLKINHLKDSFMNKSLSIKNSL